jgi:uncharacterized damage-inducible protein DinB
MHNLDSEPDMIATFRSEFARCNTYLNGVLDQIDDDTLNRLPVEGGNSIAMLVRHLYGNIRSRFTDFLDSDGEKSWRERENEFARVAIDEPEARRLWAEAWDLLDETLASLKDEDLDREVVIRGQVLTVRAALLRSLAHISYHVGQMVVMARAGVADSWSFMSIPLGGTAAYNQNPTKERG